MKKYIHTARGSRSSSSVASQQGNGEGGACSRGASILKSRVICLKTFPIYVQRKGILIIQKEKKIEVQTAGKITVVW